MGPQHREDNVVHMAESRCDNEKRQLVTSTVTIIRMLPLKLDDVETCRMATDSFLKNECGEGKGHIMNQTEAFGQCEKDMGKSKMVLTIKCDGTSKVLQFKTSTPGSQPFAIDQDCAFNINMWKQGFERKHPGACVRNRQVVPVPTSSPAPTPELTPELPLEPTPAPTLPPTDAWAEGVCAWEAKPQHREDNVVHMAESRCDNEKR